MTRYAVSHEWFSPFGGSEAVALRIADALAVDVIDTLWSERPDQRSPVLRQSVLSRTPLRRSKAAALPFMSSVWQRTSIEADVLVASSHCFGHQASLRARIRPARRVAYVHTPARYVWTPELDQRGDVPGSAPVRHWLARKDAAAARQLDGIMVNSRAVQQRVADFWGRESTVVHPPVDVDFFRAVASETMDLPDQFVLGASRFVPYKQLDKVMLAGQAAGLAVVLAGGGPGEAELRSLAASLKHDVRFVINPTDEQLRELFSRAVAYVFPASEDFGMMPIEAQACGTPVVALREGGSLETVQDQITGAHVDAPTPEQLATGIEVARSLDAARCRTHAEDFSCQRFDERIRAFVEQYA